MARISDGSRNSVVINLRCGFRLGRQDGEECEAPMSTPEGGCAMAGGMVNPKLTIQPVDVRDDQGMTVLAINGVNDSQWALGVMAGSQEAIRYEFAHTALPVFGATRSDRYRFDGLEQKALATAPSRSESVGLCYERATNQEIDYCMLRDFMSSTLARYSHSIKRNARADS